MKFLSFFLIAMFAVYVKSEDGLMKVMQECQKNVGATDEDVAKMMLHAPADNQQQKCMFSCVLAAMNVVSCW